MAEMKIRHTETAGDYSSETVFEGKDLEFIHEDLLKTLFGVKNVAPAPEGKKEVKLAAVETKQGSRGERRSNLRQRRYSLIHV